MSDIMFIIDDLGAASACLFRVSVRFQKLFLKSLKLFLNLSEAISKFVIKYTISKH